MNIEQLVKDYPNDMELGKVVRDIYRKEKEYLNQKKISNKTIKFIR